MTPTVLVTGATGTQGGAVINALAGSGYKVRALVRDLRHIGARALVDKKVSLIKGTFEYPASLDAALAGVDAVFSVQLAPFPSNPDSERNQARALVEAAQRAKVRHFIHSSVSNAGQFENMAGWAEGRWERNYWTSKADVETYVANAGFAYFTILRPAFMMENFITPKAQYMFPDLAAGTIKTAVSHDTKIALIAARDIGAAVAASIDQPERFSATRLELAGDRLTLTEVAAAIAAVSKKNIAAQTLTSEALCAQGQSPGWVKTQEWMNVVGYPARPADMQSFGLTPTSFRDWLYSEAEMQPI